MTPRALAAALRPLGRAPFFSAVAVGTLAMAVALWLVASTALAAQQRDPRPGVPLYHVSLARHTPAPEGPDPTSEWSERLLDAHLSWSDAHALCAAPPARCAMSYAGLALVRAGDVTRELRVRPASVALFDLFDLRFRAGTAWAGDDVTDAAVLGERRARQLFGTADVVGRTLTVAGRELTIVGVLAEPGVAKLWDLPSRDGTDPVLVPLAATSTLRLRPSLVQNATPREPDFDDLLAGEHGFVQLWVELPDAHARAVFAATADRLIEGSAARRRPIRAARLRSTGELLRELYPAVQGYTLLHLFSLIALAGSLLAVTYLLMAKFLAEAPRLGIQRALGASRRRVFAGLLGQAALVGVASGLVGVLGGWAGLRAVNHFVRFQMVTGQIGVREVAAGVALALAASVAASLYPAWRAARLPPAAVLRRQ